MKPHVRTVLSLFGFVLATGYASTLVADWQEYNRGKLPYPRHTWLSDCAPASGEIPAGCVLAGSDPLLQGIRRQEKGLAVVHAADLLNGKSSSKFTPYLVGSI